MPSSPDRQVLPATAPSPDSDRETVHLALLAEFDRLNRTHFDGALTLAELVVSTRKQYGGYCQPARRRIVVSWRAFQEHGWEETLTTFRHEVAHLVHPNHSPEFWDLAHRLGCPRDRRHALPPKDHPAGWYRYVYRCVACGHQVYRRKRLAKASCARCDRRYNPDFALTLVPGSKAARPVRLPEPEPDHRPPRSVAG